jgi:hypothetical protein
VNIFVQGKGLGILDEAGSFGYFVFSVAGALVTLCFQLLELEQEKGKEAQELLEKKQHKLLQFAELEQEVTLLRNENRNLQ